MQRRFAVLWLGTLLIASLGPVPVGAQSLDRIDETRSTVRYFYFARPGEATVQVSVWGTVPQPGIYEIPLGTDLERLLTMAGGTANEPRTEDVERQTTVRLYRPRGGARELLYEASVEELLRETSRYPELQDEDVMVVETTVDEQFRLRDVFTYVSGIATVVLLIDRLVSN